MGRDSLSILYTEVRGKILSRPRTWWLSGHYHTKNRFDDNNYVGEKNVPSCNAFFLGAGSVFE